MKKLATTLVLCTLITTSSITAATAATPVPRPAATIPQIQAVESIQGHTYVIKSGKVYIDQAKTPLAIPAKVKSIAAGDRFVVFLAEDQRVFFMGQLHDQSFVSYDWRKPAFSSAKPIPLPLTGVNKVIAGRNEIFLFTASRDLYVMGANGSSQLGVKGQPFVNRPTKLIAGARSVSSYENATIVIADSGIYATGYNASGNPTRVEFQRIGDSGNLQHVFHLESTFSSVNSSAGHYFFIPAQNGGWAIQYGNITSLKPLTDQTYFNGTSFKKTPYTDFLVKANGEVWVRYAYRARGVTWINSGTKHFDFDGMLYTNYELLATNAVDAGIWGKTLYIFRKGTVATKPYPSKQELIKKIMQANKGITSLHFNSQEGIFNFEHNLP